MVISQTAKNAALVARIGLIASRLRIDIGGVAQAMPLLGDALREPLVGLAADGSALAVSVAAPRDGDWRDRIGRLAQLLGADPMAPARMFEARDAHHVRIELQSTPAPAGLAATIHWFGASALDDDLTDSVLLGIGDAVRLTLADRASFLARDPAARGATCAFALRLALGEPTEVALSLALSGDEAALPDAMGRVLALAKELGAPAAQRTLFERIHPLLAAGGPAVVTLRASTRAVRPELIVGWNGARWGDRGWDTALRVITGLAPHAPSDAAKRLGDFSGILDGATVAGIEMAFGPSDPPAAWIRATPA